MVKWSVPYVQIRLEYPNVVAARVFLAWGVNGVRWRVSGEAEAFRKVHFLYDVWLRAK